MEFKINQINSNRLGEFHEETLTLLGRYVYLLQRNVVEMRGATREKDPRVQAWVLRLKEENGCLCDALDKILEHLTQRQSLAHIFQINHITEQMKSIQLMLRSHISTHSRVQKKDIKCIYAKVVEVLVEFSQRTCKILQPTYVTADAIEQTASQLIGIPVSRVLNSHKPRLEDIRKRLCRRIVDQDHIIDCIINVLSSPRSSERVRRPIASFLFFCGSLFYEYELYEALCEELFYSKDLLVKFDLSDYTDVLPSQDSNGLCLRKGILDAVRSNPFCVLLLENVEKANIKTISFLCDILRGDGKTDNELNEYDFSNTLILMTSEVGKNVFRVQGCDCLNMEHPIKESGLNKMEHNCVVVSTFREAQLPLVLDLLDFVDGVMSFKGVSWIGAHVFTRMRLREATYSIGQERKLIVYASEAAVRIIMSDHLPTESGGGASLRNWIEDHIVPKLYDMVSEVNHGGFFTVYIDTLIGTDELSYRLELVNSADDSIMKESTNFFNQLRCEYHREQGIVNYFDNLESLNDGLIDLMVDSDKESFVCQVPMFKAMDNSITSILKYAFDASLCNTDSVPPLNIFRREADLQLKRWDDARGRMRMDGLRIILHSNKAGSDAVNVIIEAVLGLSNACVEELPCLTKSFLFLGLTVDGKSDLLESLVQHSVTDHKRYSIISIDMEDHGDTSSLIQFIGDILSHSSSDDHGEYNLLPGSDCTTLPRILVIDQVEKARVPVFSVLLSLLDHGILRSEDGKLFDFRNSVVVMMSNLGDKKMLSCVVRNIFRTQNGTDTRMLTRQVGNRFRTELLNYVDEILMFDPLTGSQLEKFSSLSLRVGPHLEYDDVRLEIPTALLVLFEEPNESKISPMWQSWRDYAASLQLSRVLENNWIRSLKFERGARGLAGYTSSNITSYLAIYE